MRFIKLTRLLVVVFVLIAGFILSSNDVFSQSSDVQLNNEIPVNGNIPPASQQSAWRYYYINIPSNTTDVSFDVYGITGDVDLYVNYGTKPTTAPGTWTCRPFVAGPAAESCYTSEPAPGTWWVGILNFHTGENNFTVSASYSVGVEEPPAPPSTPSGTEAITGTTGSTLRNNYDGSVGFQFVAGETKEVTHLGRWVVEGNSGSHTVTIYNDAMSPLGSVTVNTAGATPNQFAYSALSSVVTLNAGQTYFVMSSESHGGDQWYEHDQNVSENSSLVTNITAAYGYGIVVPGSESYGPPSFIYRDIAVPPPPPVPVYPPGLQAVTGRSGGTLRSDYTGPVGFRFVADRNGELTHLGRWVVEGNTGTHLVQLLDESMSALANAYVDTSSIAPGYFKYVALGSPIPLIDGQTYYILSHENAWGDQWYGLDQSVTQDTSMVSQMTAAYGAGSVAPGNESYGPVSFVYQPDTTPPKLGTVNATNITSSSARIEWTTDEPATSQVHYGPTSGYGSWSAASTTYKTNHFIDLSGLSPNTTYHYRIVSIDSDGNQLLSLDYTFFTGSVGWAWSSNIGWIQFHTGRNQPILLNENTGELTGYAWSSNIGWIKFGDLSGEVDGITVTNAHVATSGPSKGKVSGWIRACAGTVSGNCNTMDSRTDGWDGWIELSGTNHPSPDLSGNGGVTYYEETSDEVTKGYIKGYAWGGEVVGWVYFSTDISTRLCVRNCGESSAPPPSCVVGVVVNGSAVTVHYTIYDRNQNSNWRLQRSVIPTGGSIITERPPDNINPIKYPFISDYQYTFNSTPGDYYHMFKRQGSNENVCVTNGPSRLPGIDTQTPDITMWLDNDPGEAKESIVVKRGESVQVNWRKSAATDIGHCIANFDTTGLISVSEGWPSDFYDPNDPTTHQRLNDQNPYTIPASKLTRGEHTFSMQCRKPYSEVYDLIGKTRAQNQTLKITVTESTIREE